MWALPPLDYEGRKRLKERGQKVTLTEGSRTYTSTHIYLFLNHPRPQTTSSRRNENSSSIKVRGLCSMKD